MAIYDLEIDDLEIDISTVLQGFLTPPPKKKDEEETDNGEDD